MSDRDENGFIEFEGKYEYYAATIFGWSTASSPFEAVENLKKRGLISKKREHNNEIILCRYPKENAKGGYEIENFLPIVNDLDVFYSPFHKTK